MEYRDMLMRDVLDQNVSGQKLPSANRVFWEPQEKPGDGLCYLRDEVTLSYPRKTDGTTVMCTGAEFKLYMKERYGQNYVRYCHREPDFKPFQQVFSAESMNNFLRAKYGDCAVQTMNSHPGIIIVGQMGINRIDTYAEASGRISEALGIRRTDVEEYMKNQNLTWHECGDRKTIIAIPTEINAVFGHTGGIGIEKDARAFVQHIEEKLDGNSFVLVRSEYGEKLQSNGLESAIKGLRKSLKKRKRSILKVRSE